MSPANYGEELVYWYLRLNGFFPITNYVIHRDRGLRWSSDCDILAVRPPYVSEEVGGVKEDWDALLCRDIYFNRTVGVICEVKTGVVEKIFRSDYVGRSVRRLGLIRNPRNAVSELANSATFTTDVHQICKVLVADSNQPPVNCPPHIFVPLSHVRDFIRDRIRKYPVKHSDRMFFPSSLLQAMIWEVRQERNDARASSGISVNAQRSAAGTVE
jgi:hypothetical protein